MYDILIIGSGPAGLSAAIYGKRAQLSLAVVEKDYLSTGQIAVTERVDNYPGLYGVSGYDLGEKFRSHAEALSSSTQKSAALKRTALTGALNSQTEVPGPRAPSFTLRVLRIAGLGFPVGTRALSLTARCATASFIRKGLLQSSAVGTPRSATRCILQSLQRRCI